MFIMNMKKYIMTLAAALMTFGALADVAPNTMNLTSGSTTKPTLLIHNPSYQIVGANHDSIQAYKNGEAYGNPMALANYMSLSYEARKFTTTWYISANQDTLRANEYFIDGDFIQFAYATISQDDFTYTKVDTAKAVITPSENCPFMEEPLTIAYFDEDSVQVDYAVYPGKYAVKFYMTQFPNRVAVDSFTIAKAPATVTAHDAEKVYGDLDPEGFFMDTVGVIEGDWVSLDIAREAGEAVGSYAINAKIGEVYDAPARASERVINATYFYDWTFNPGTFTINPMTLEPTTGSESEFFLVSATGYCQNDEGEVLYSIENGNPVAYSVTFSAEAKAQGFQDIAKTELPAGDIKSFALIVPENCHYGKYSADVYFYPALDIDPIKVPVTFTVNIPTVDIKQLFDDVVAIDNKEGKYTSYQWYHNGELIPGATLQYYQEKGGLSGSYYVEVTVEGLDYEAHSCVEDYEAEKKAPAAQKVLRSNEVIIITPNKREYNAKGQVIK